MLFKKKETKNTQDCKIQFKAKHSTDKSRRKRAKISKEKSFTFACKTIKPPRGRKNSRAEKVKKIKRRNSILGIVLIVFILSFAIFLGYSTINFITGIRGGTFVEDIFYEQKYVRGIDSVPIYPNSEFVYQDREDEEMVMKMLNQGITVYRLPRNTRTSNVYDYYKENLPNDLWEYIATIPVSTDEELLGQYWLKDEKGLRIHVENNDVWYELITRNEAESSLNERRVSELQRKRVLETSTKQTLLPDFPWILSIPREYLIMYSSTDLKELQSVKISNLSSDSFFSINPIGDSNSYSYYQLLSDFIEKQGGNSEEKWSITSSTTDFKKEREVLIANILVNGQPGEAVVLVNKRNFIVYAIITNEVGHPFFEQIIDEIQEP